MTDASSVGLKSSGCLSQVKRGVLDAGETGFAVGSRIMAWKLKVARNAKNCCSWVGEFKAGAGVFTITSAVNKETVINEPHVSICSFLAEIASKFANFSSFLSSLTITFETTVQIRDAIISHGCFLHECSIEHSVVGMRSRVDYGADLKGVQEADRPSEGFYIRSGITTILKSATVKDGTVI
ncbi:hypothetical protein GW17_00020361 [Ensete ventricosum]|nr:hypothetical protein GW17_00020361 [Ensete ventricosum]